MNEVVRGTWMVGMTSIDRLEYVCGALLFCVRSISRSGTRDESQRVEDLRFAVIREVLCHGLHGTHVLSHARRMVCWIRITEIDRGRLDHFVLAGTGSGGLARDEELCPACLQLG